jgi:hypothetical protein
MYSVCLAKVPVDAASSASFMYAVARTCATVQSCGTTGNENLPAKPKECFILFRVRLLTVAVESFEKLARIKLTMLDDTQPTASLTVNSLQEYLELPYTVQVSPEGLDALQQYSSSAIPSLSFTPPTN